jgi:hypothetical protein
VSQAISTTAPVRCRISLAAASAPARADVKTGFEELLAIIAIFRSGLGGPCGLGEPHADPSATERIATATWKRLITRFMCRSLMGST